MDNKIVSPQSSEKDSKETYYGVGSFLFEVVKVFLLAIVIIIPIRVFLFQPFFVHGQSMEPNFEQGEYLIINEFGYKQTEVGVGNFDAFTVEPFRKLAREDVIVFRYPRNPSQFFIKRVIALPGERITVKDSTIRIFNEETPGGFTFVDPYIPKEFFTKGDIDVTLAEDEYYVMGDNREHSHDSRSWGPLKEDKVIGKVIFRAWPLKTVGTIQD